MRVLSILQNTLTRTLLGCQAMLLIPITKLGHSGVASTQLAFAEATVSGYAIGLYSAESNVTAGIQDNPTWTSRPDTQADAFNGTPADYGGSLSGSGDDALGLTFQFFQRISR